MANKFKALRIALSFVVMVLIIGAFGFYNVFLKNSSDETLNSLHKLFLSITRMQFTVTLASLHSGMIYGLFGTLLILVLTLLFGRVYCAVMCPMGIFQDFVAFVRTKVLRRKKTVEAVQSSKLKFVRIVLFILYSAFLVTGLTVSVSLLDPYAIFGRFLNVLNPNYYNYYATGQVEYDASGAGVNIQSFDTSKLYAITVITVVVMLLITIASLISRRFFCHNICPVGTILGFFAKKPIFGLYIDSEKCRQCGKCTINCAGDNCLDIEHKKLDNSTCVMCMNCLDLCSFNAIKINSFKQQTKENQRVTDIGEKYHDLSRRQFLSALSCGIVAGTTSSLLAKNNDKKRVEQLVEKDIMPVMPPGSMNLEEFKSKCIGCHKCVRACPSNVLQVSTFNYGGFSNMFLPYLDFDAGMCNDFCFECIKACPTGALKILREEQRKLWKIGKVEYMQNICVVETNREACGACGEHCPTGAIQMEDFGDGLTIPVVDDTYCIGCGSCQNICPVLPMKAILVTGVAEQKLIKAKPESEIEKVVHEEEFPF
ncbi:4Fe-4S dicluster domain-containing protein [Lentisphaerota bacterium WC36G]|nr:4Fe-4S dicluster domain-containing protein [Lentisphaerae bacterium WC36]